MKRTLEIANAVQQIWALEPGRGITVYIANTPYHIRVSPPKPDGVFAGDWVWDQVSIEGHNMGNRFGGVRSLLIACGEREADYEFADRHAVALAARLEGGAR